MMGMYGAGGSGLAWFGMGILWLALIGVIVWLAIRLATHRNAQPSATLQAETLAPKPPNESALEILDRRLATGEIDVETYKASRDAIRETRGEPK
ncbi:SHOCT domain-containing protein [Demequina capsici]|uniref:SHOCT domain-containing protein n=1 Tax=Demequina capsici TaxID=3075620 RepID=A0AA96F769_9MICO|nr:SHOCT domain-containing protein [Demequina sp. OYTSA14]WNM24864.1 SHOCT domain-containing protein [Demequina sp. OYTSA14]